MGNLIFNDISSEAMGIRIASAPAYTCPEKVVDATHIPSKNGDVLLDTESFNNVPRSYSMSLPIEEGEFSYYASKISGWLNGPSGYSRLEDSYEPDYYRLARFKGELQISNAYDQALLFDAEFDCKPQRFLKSGEQYIEFARIESGTQINTLIKNPTDFTAKPLYKISVSTMPYTNPESGGRNYCSFGATFTDKENSQTTNFNIQYYPDKEGESDTISAHTIYYDSESGSAFKDTSTGLVSINHNVYNYNIVTGSNGEFLGNNVATPRTLLNVDRIEVMPRWWTL